MPDEELEARVSALLDDLLTTTAEVSGTVVHVDVRCGVASAAVGAGSA